MSGKILFLPKVCFASAFCFCFCVGFFFVCLFVCFCFSFTENIFWTVQRISESFKTAIQFCP